MICFLCGFLDGLRMLFGDLMEALKEKLTFGIVESLQMFSKTFVFGQPIKFKNRMTNILDAFQRKYRDHEKALYKDCPMAASIGINLQFFYFGFLYLKGCVFCFDIKRLCNTDLLKVDVSPDFTREKIKQMDNLQVLVLCVGLTIKNTFICD